MSFIVRVAIRLIALAAVACSAVETPASLSQTEAQQDQKARKQVEGSGNFLRASRIRSHASPAFAHGADSVDVGAVPSGPTVDGTNVNVSPHTGHSQFLKNVSLVQASSPLVDAESKEMLLAVKMPSIVLSCQDLDKTTYPHDDVSPSKIDVFKKNLKSMEAFEKTGGMVLPVTGNNLQMAQMKFDEAGNGHNVADFPGIFGGGSISLGAGGEELEKWSLGNMMSNKAPSTSFVSDMLTLVESEEFQKQAPEVALILLLSKKTYAYVPEKASPVATEAFKGYATELKIWGQELTKKEGKEQILKEAADVVQIVFAFGPKAGSKLSDGEWNEAQEKLSKVRNLVYQKIKEQNSYTLKSNPNNILVGDLFPGSDSSTLDPNSMFLGGIKVPFPMRNPYPELDITVAGADKGSALSRFVENKAIIEALKEARGGEETSLQGDEIAVFGDEKNDISMFEAIGNQRAAIRVAMRIHNPDLAKQANGVGEVYEWLNLITKARKGPPKARSPPPPPPSPRSAPQRSGAAPCGICACSSLVVFFLMELPMVAS